MHLARRLSVPARHCHTESSLACQVCLHLWSWPKSKSKWWKSYQGLWLLNFLHGITTATRKAYSLWDMLYNVALFRSSVEACIKMGKQITVWMHKAQCCHVKKKKNGSRYSHLENVWNELQCEAVCWRGLWSQHSARADCDLWLLPGTCTFSIPHIDSSSVLDSHERLKFLHIFWKHWPCWERSTGRIVCFMLTRILYRYMRFLCISHEHELKYSIWVKCYFS